MVQSIPIFKVVLSEGLVNIDLANSDKIFGYAIEANKGPIAEPIYVASSTEAKRIFGKSFAPHFYQGGAGLALYRVAFKDATAPSITYQFKVNSGETESTVDVLKVTATTPGTAKHKVNLSKSLTRTDAYNLTVTIEDVGSKKYQNIKGLTNVVKRINSKFADYLKAELLVADDSSLYLPANLVIPKNQQGVVQDTLSNGSNGKLLKADGTTSTMNIPDDGLHQDTAVTGEANIESTLLYAYRDAFKALEDVDLLGVATLSNSESVQNELIEHINELIDPEVAKYRWGVTGFLKYPAKDSNGYVNATDAIGKQDLIDGVVHIDNPFIVCVSGGVVFKEDNATYNLLPHEAVQLYTGIRSKLGYQQAIFGGAQSKVLKGVVDVLPLTTDGEDILKEDREELNQCGAMTFMKKYNEVRFLQGVTTAQDSPVLSHESIMSIVIHVLRRLVVVAWPFMGELLTEDLKASFVKALSTELQNITDTDGSLMPLEDYNIPPYDVEVKATTVTGFNDAGELVRETKIAAVVKIVPRGAIDAIELSVMVI